MCSSDLMWFAGKGDPGPSQPAWLILFVLAVSFLEVSSVPYRTTKSLKLSPRTMAVLVVFAGVCLAIGAVFDISTVLVLIGLAHVVSGPLEAAVTWPRRRKARRRTRESGEPPPDHPE